MRRKPRNVVLDPKIWAIVENEAETAGISVNRWLENHLHDYFQMTGQIDKSEKRLGEIRGGKR